MSNSPNSHNLPLNIPPLEVLTAMTGQVPEDVKERILEAPLSDDLSGLREMAHRLHIPDSWDDISQPKQEIGDYVEASGFNVPHRFESFEEALHVARTGGTVLMRSEHPQEYDGFSGLLESYRINQESLARTSYLDVITERLNAGESLEDVIHFAKWDSLDKLPMKRYLGLSNQRAEDFYDEMSYSFWEYIPGTNVMVAADDAISGRYHITARDRARPAAGGWIVDAAGIEEPGPKEFPNMKDAIGQEMRASLIQAYESIRHLPRFSERICPIMELQVDADGKIWFLQYHKARPFRAAPEQLKPDDYPGSDGWYKAEAVRGALGSLVTLGAALWYPTNSSYNSVPTYVPDGSEEASFDAHFDHGFSEFIARSRIAYLSAKSRQMFYLDMADNSHELRSRWLKPYGALSLGDTVFEALVPKTTKDTILKMRREHQMARVVLDLASDGRQGFVRLNPETEIQPAPTAY